MTWYDWLLLLGHMMTLSFMAIGGAITLAPEMQRYLVLDKAWLSNEQFTASIAMAQSAPGPNLLFVALFGWHIGMNASTDIYIQTGLGIAGALLCLLGILIPSTTLVLYFAKWAQKNQQVVWVKAFKQGMTPIVIGMLLATAWILTSNLGNHFGGHDYGLLLLALGTVLLTLKTKVHILWLLLVGAILGASGLV